MAELFRPSFFQPDSSAGVPLAGAKLFFYQAGTTTAITVYQDNALGTPHASPVVADASGIFAPIYLGTAVTSYKTVLKTSADVTVQTVDNISLLDATGIFADNVFTLQDNLDTTKQVVFQASGITTATTRTMTVPDENGTLVVQSSAGVTTLTSTDAGAGAGPDLVLYRNSASPAAADLIGRHLFQGEDSAGNTETYASISSTIADPTSGSEDATMTVRTAKAGSLTDYLYVGANAAGTTTADAIGLPRGQLSFPAAQVASTDANTLDDYEEGTASLFLNAATPGDISATYTTREATYTKIGRLVTLRFHIVTSSWTHTTASGNFLITGAPFAAGTTAVGTLQYTGYTNATYPAHLTIRLASGSTDILVYRNATAQANTASQIGDWPTGGSLELVGAITYFV